jgi:hypothetical protein
MQNFALLVDVADTVTGVLSGQWFCDFDWLICDWVRGPTVLMHLGIIWRALLCPISVCGSPVALLNFQVPPPPRLLQVMFPGSKKKDPR